MDKIHYGDNGTADFIARNPISPCPDSPNCVRLSLDFDLDTEDLMNCTEITLKRMQATDIKTDNEGHSIDCVFKVFIFKDDVTIFCEPLGSGSLLHLKSSSRVGYGDLGVNKRRVRNFLSELELLIKERKKV